MKQASNTLGFPGVLDIPLETIYLVAEFVLVDKSTVEDSIFKLF